jgi:hypothetical protein
LQGAILVAENAFWNSQCNRAVQDRLFEVAASPAQWSGATLLKIIKPGRQAPTVCLTRIHAVSQVGVEDGTVIVIVGVSTPICYAYRWLDNDIGVWVDGRDDFGRYCAGWAEGGLRKKGWLARD